MKTFLALFIFFFLLFPSPTEAEGNCPEGYYPIGTPSGQAGPQGCAPIPGYSSQQNETLRPPPHWISRWLAVAADGPNGILGTAVDLATPEDAKRLAMRDCINQGGKQCEIVLSQGNGCAAMAAGKTGWNVQGAETIDEAKEKSMQVCADSSPGCVVYFSACSLPKKIQ